MGVKAPLIHRICMMDMLEYHLSVMVMIISSSDTIPSRLRGAYTRVLSGYPSLFGQKKSLS